MLNPNILVMKTLKIVFCFVLVFALFYGARFLSANTEILGTIENKVENIYFFSSFLSLWIILRALSLMTFKKVLLKVYAALSFLFFSCGVAIALFSELGYYNGPMAGDHLFFILLIASGIAFLLDYFRMESEV
jgi:hypothetical protein